MERNVDPCTFGLLRQRGGKISGKDAHGSGAKPGETETGPGMMLASCNRLPGYRSQALWVAAEMFDVMDVDSIGPKHYDQR
jgi:hypothetical protein